MDRTPGLPSRLQSQHPPQQPPRGPHPHCAHPHCAHGFVQPQVIQAIGQPLGFSCFLPGQDACQDSHLLPLPSDVHLYERMSRQAAAAENRSAASESRAASEQPPTSFRAVAQARPETLPYGRSLVRSARQMHSAVGPYERSHEILVHMLQAAEIRAQVAECRIKWLQIQLAECKEGSHPSKLPAHASELRARVALDSAQESKHRMEREAARARQSICCAGKAPLPASSLAPPPAPPPPPCV